MGSIMLRLFVAFAIFSTFGHSAVVHNVKVSWLQPNETKVPGVTTETTTKTEEKSTAKLTNLPGKEKSSTSLPQKIANEFLVKMINQLREKHRQQAFKREVAAMKSTPKDEADESLFGKVYGFFKHVGHKIKDTFQAVYDWFG